MIVLDGKKFKASRVAFFQNKGGVLYGRVSKGNFYGKEYISLSKSTYHSNNLYFFSTRASLISNQSVGTQKGYRVIYTYSYGINQMKLINYRNAHEDIRNHPLSAKYLEKARKNRKNEFIFLFTGIAFCTTSLFMPNYGLVGAFVGAGISCYGTSFGFRVAKQRNVHRAYKAYSGYGFDGQRWLNK